MIQRFQTWHRVGVWVVTGVLQKRYAFMFKDKAVWGKWRETVWPSNMVTFSFFKTLGTTNTKTRRRIPDTQLWNPYISYWLVYGCPIISLYFPFPANYFLIPVGSVLVSEAMLSSFLLLKVHLPVALYNFSFASVLPSSWSCVLKYYSFFTTRVSPFQETAHPKQFCFDSCFRSWFCKIG